MSLLIFTYYHSIQLLQKLMWMAQIIHIQRNLRILSHTSKQHNTRQKRNEVVVSIYSFIYHGIAPIPIFIMVLHLRSSHSPFLLYILGHSRIYHSNEYFTNI